MRKYWLEISLIVAIGALVGQLAWPATAAWWRRPGPGAVGFDQCAEAGLAGEYLVYLPPRYHAEPWPLVVYLHGAGERGTDPAILRRWGPFAALQEGIELPAIVVAPQCLRDHHWHPASVMAFVEQVATRYHVDRRQIYLVGFSMGAYGTWEAAAAYPNEFAAIVPICGGGDPDHAKSILHTPVWAFHGDQDEVVPLAESEQMIHALRTAGGTPRLTILPGAGHGISNDVCNRPDLWKWLLAQQREIPSR